MRILNRQDARKIKRKSDRGHSSLVLGNEEEGQGGSENGEKSQVN